LAIQGMDTLTRYCDTNRDGVVDATEATQEYITAVAKLNNYILGLPDSKDININVHINTWESVPGSGKPGRPGGPITDPIPTSTGGDFIVPPGYQHDSFPILVQTGERVIVIPRGEPGNATSVINDNIDRLVANMPMMSGAVNGTSSPVYSSTYSNSATNYSVPITVNANVNNEQDLHRLAYQIAREFNQRTNR
jgi:hypothetical protein